MTPALLVPMQLDVLRLTRPTTVAGALMDFERLPWPSREWGRDVNADTPFLSSAIIRVPFGGSDRVLEAGFHLHWILPEALRRGRIDRDTGKTVFPAVPNRWLVTRVLDTAMTRWVVESDYRWPSLAAWTDMEGGHNGTGSPAYRKNFAVTLLAHDSKNPQQPFQHVGRAFAFADWQETNPKCRLDTALTAIGYGDPTFAAYHPHCHTVFGFSDVWDDPKTMPSSVEYRVMGWYSDTTQDPLAAENIPWSSEKLSSNDFLWTLASHQWKVQLPKDEAPPKRTFGFASTRVNANDTPPTPGPTVAAVANTGTEAMSVYLAAQLSAMPGTSEQEDILRATIEDQIEAIQLRSELGNRDKDLAVRLRSLRHERGFRPERGAPIWKRAVNNANLEVPSELAPALDFAIQTLNSLEAELQQYRLDHRAARQALYADWCKYMHVAYRPPDDDPNQYVEIDAAKQYIERVHMNGDPSGGTTVITAKAALMKTVQMQIDRVRTTLHQNITDALLKQGKLTVGAVAPELLEQTPGPQYWRPNDPVVLMTGGPIRARKRLTPTTGPLPCQRYQFGDDSWPPANSEMVALTTSSLLAVPAKLDANSPGLMESDGRPWNPLFLEWGVDLYPAEGHSLGRSGGVGTYDPNVILDNYDIPSRSPDLAPRLGLDVVADPDRFDGRTFLSAHVANTVGAQLNEYLTEELLERYRPMEDERLAKEYRDKLNTWYDKTKVASFFAGDCLDVKKRAALETWYLARPLAPDGAKVLQDKSATARFEDPIWTAIRALGELFDSNGNAREFLSSSLEGFHDELLGFAQYPVLPIDEPIGFGTYREFSSTVGRLTGQDIATPEPTNPYSPIRSGEFELSGLSIVDSFGQSLDIAPTRIFGPIRSTADARAGAMYFPPRVAQAMNVKFRWLDAEQQSAELAHGNDVICGWLVPNPGNGSITVFSRAGEGLGLLTPDRDEKNIEWVPAPGRPAIARDPKLTSRQRDVLQMDAAITNVHLRRVVNHLWEAPTAYFEAFMDCLADARENIDPQGSQQYSSLAMLMGQPLAVARAELDIYPLHDAVTRGDWLDFERRIRGGAPSDEGFKQVQFPIRLGEYAQLDDGLAGYWIENRQDSRFEDKCFYAQAADDVATLKSATGLGKFGPSYQIKAHVAIPDDSISLHRFIGQTINIKQTIAAPPLSVTVLFDPRGVVHLNTGILPTKVISIPPACFVEALASIELWFKAGPLLGRIGENELPLPSDPEYDVFWRDASWSKTTDGKDVERIWDDLRATPTIRRVDVLDGIKTCAPATSLEILEAKYWLKCADPNGIRYHVLPKDKRERLGQDDSVENALRDFIDQHATQINESLLKARFDKRIEAREGWVVFERRRNAGAE